MHTYRVSQNLKHRILLYSLRLAENSNFSMIVPTLKPYRHFSANLLMSIYPTQPSGGKSNPSSMLRQNAQQAPNSNTSLVLPQNKPTVMISYTSSRNIKLETSPMPIISRINLGRILTARKSVVVPVRPAHREFSSMIPIQPIQFTESACVPRRNPFEKSTQTLSDKKE